MEVVDAVGTLCAATSGADDVVSSTYNGAEAEGAVETANGALDEAWSVPEPAYAAEKRWMAAEAQHLLFGKIGRLWDEAVRDIWVMGTRSKSEMNSVNPAVIRDGCEKARWISPPNPCPADLYQSRMLTRINQADFKCVMAAMDLDHQLSDTSRATKEAEPEEQASERGRAEPEPEPGFYCDHGTFTQVDELGEDRRSERSDVESKPGLEYDVQNLCSSREAERSVADLSGVVGVQLKCRIADTSSGSQRPPAAPRDDARRRGAAALAKTKDIGRIFKGARAEQRPYQPEHPAQIPLPGSPDSKRPAQKQAETRQVQSTGFRFTHRLSASLGRRLRVPSVERDYRRALQQSEATAWARLDAEQNQRRALEARLSAALAENQVEQARLQDEYQKLQATNVRMSEALQQAKTEQQKQLEALEKLAQRRAAEEAEKRNCSQLLRFRPLGQLGLLQFASA
ncbi:hypothetical protein PHYSODRAFT_323748 [Phytophthora sojae]|uniref:Uncharacterized protein n=1 Tax=Phytophthora sojae (strain P6497) TaxID=1094619 RepID=G4YLH6_PHYSP|nr:hypothetical protein PHYSODRAFT_323748 [Phytophthora sojae]EGZ30350.1 hypothetical protein PHYSODRAFT_323748 [Phytophthora sojae]|eukprot:XP_009517625.1 hypothetical protein PHYSODRAFT_323748 [Phytophthora sojae]